jgi:hypothetical protein
MESMHVGALTAHCTLGFTRLWTEGRAGGKKIGASDSANTGAA